MKINRDLDFNIAEKIMNLKIVNKDDIPKYSSNIEAAYEVISRMQKLGWSFHVRSTITQAGNLIYRARFTLGKKQTENFSPSLTGSICIAALMIVNNQYFEYIDEEEDERPIAIIGNTGAEPILKNIDISEEPLEELLSRSLKDYELPSENGLKFSDILVQKDLRKLPSSLLNFFVDILNENNYCISKKIDD